MGRISVVKRFRKFGIPAKQNWLEGNLSRVTECHEFWKESNGRRSAAPPRPPVQFDFDAGQRVKKKKEWKGSAS